MYILKTIHVLFALLILTGSLKAVTIVVDSGTDPIDIDWQTATFEDLPGPDGRVSFSEANIVANNVPGKDTIHFAIPQNEWGYQWLYPGRAVIQSSYTFFWRAFEPVVVDGRTQTAFTGDTNPNGAEVTLFGGEYYMNAGESELYGFDGASMSFGGSNNYASENHGFMNMSIFGGSGNVLEGNTFATIKIDRSDSNVVIGNVCHRIRVWGFGSAERNHGVRIGGPNPSDRNYILGYGSVNSEGLPSGHAIQLFETDGALIENNWIGTSQDGLAQGNQYCSIGISFETGNVNAVVRDNMISGILGHGTGPHYAGFLFGRGIMLGGMLANILIENNVIGPDVNGDPTLGSVTGIEVGTYNYQGISNLIIQDNAIAGHRYEGVTVGNNVAQARLSRNLMFANTSLGIDLVPTNFGYGVTPNDALDGDTGGNGLQNFPVLSSAASGASSVSISGTLNSLPSAEFTLEFFASPECHSTGYGEGRMYLGNTVVTTDGSGNASFDVTLAAAVPNGWVASSTATLEPAGLTSEFSACLGIESAPCQEIPANLSLWIEDGLAVLQWQPTAEATDYEVLAAPLEGGDYQSLGTTGGLTTFQDVGMPDFPSRRYVVRALCN
ncbi:MAG: hypothetical protein H6508_03180 [Calditrichaeota bacterium]|nr:hypothetical protein [Calditrichota bacterium]